MRNQQIAIVYLLSNGQRIVCDGKPKCIGLLIDGTKEQAMKKIDKTLYQFYKWNEEYNSEYGDLLLKGIK